MQVWSYDDGAWQQGDRASAKLRWFDLTAGDDAALADLAVRYQLHPLTIEACRTKLLHAPKVDDFGEYLFIVLQGVRNGLDGPTHEELDAYLGADFLITYEEDRDPAGGGVVGVDSALRTGIGVRPGVDGIFYEIADRIVDALLPQITALGEQLDAIDEQVLGGQHAEHQRRILRLRADAGRMRRVLTPQLTVMQRLGRDEFAQVAPGNRVYFRDIYDHLVRIDLGLEGLREDAEVALSTYLSAFNNRVSDVMRVLTVVGSLALPASLIAGIFGTNFTNVPLLHDDWGFAAMISAMVAVAGSMALYFHTKGWF
jgi:magnesium transporter